ncbi:MULTISPECIES: hypothetical protein [unclassified Variovorax]|uniref:hypothetical protein n=1 Tax=unclassified Variovorax TaxID=663243 RepID=UPI0008CDA2DA|nr:MULTISPECIES: hypothetical protein [unclassified Variovorax]SEK10703.1 hypothetical protein SAMN05518853_109260 [Variovorax sp. OK202]SFD69447.1 hypothetical protein SAMN05444746_109260 [Variovorax sp. OK212]
MATGTKEEGVGARVPLPPVKAIALAPLQSRGFRLPDLGITWILYPILVVYFLPILAIAWAAIITDGFAADNVSLSFAQVMASDFYGALRQTIGVIFVPFLTAYAVKIVSAEARIPISTAALFYILLSFFVLTVVMYGVVDVNRERLAHYDTTVDGKQVSLPVFFRAATTTYAKELLAYIAIVLGISLKK